MMRRGAAAYEDAFEELGLAPRPSERELKRAYRARTAAHPPDRDPEAFQRIREAYELLARPESALGRLLSTETHVAPSLRPPPELDVARALPLAVLRAAVAELDAGALLGGGDGG